MHELDTKDLWSNKDYAAFFGIREAAVSSRVHAMPQHPGRNTRDPVWSKACFKRSDLVQWSNEYHHWHKNRCAFALARLEQMSPEQLREWGIEPIHFEAAKVYDVRFGRRK